MCTLSVSKVIYHKFSHSAAFYMLNGKNVNVMLESVISFCDKNVRRLYNAKALFDFLSAKNSNAFAINTFCSIMSCYK